jgi:hypothetical protein
MRIIPFIGICLAALLCAAACSEDSPQEPCAPFVFHAVWVSVQDADTGSRLQTASGFIREGGFIDSLHINEGLGRAGEERPGTYEVVVFKTGYRTWREDSVVVTRDECHVQTVRFDIFLERE